jgi:hypothetical protein
MELSFLLVADYANVTANGKLNIMGIFNNVFAQGFPTVHSEMYVVAQLTAPTGEFGRRFHLEIKLIDEDGQEVACFPTDHIVPEPPPGLGRRVEMNQILRLNNIVFPKPGVYEFRVLVDNDTKGTRAIEVAPAPPPE